MKKKLISTIFLTLSITVSAQSSIFDSEQTWSASWSNIQAITGTSNFWVPNYAGTTYTHVGFDFHVPGCTVAASIRPNLCGNLKNPNFGEVTNPSPHRRIRYLMDHGVPIYTNFLHQNVENHFFNRNTYISKGQIIGRESNVDTDAIHQHIESLTTDEDSIWATTANSDRVGLSSIKYNGSFLYSGVSASNTQRQYLNPRNIISTGRVLLPTLATCSTENATTCNTDKKYATTAEWIKGDISISRSPTNQIEMQYGISTHNAAGNDGLINRANVQIPSTYTLSNGKWLARSWQGTNDIDTIPLTITSTSTNGSSSARHNYPTGDYFFTPVTKVINNAGTGFDITKGYPTLFAVLPNSNSFIVDDESNADFILDEGTGHSFSKIPGYFRTGKLITTVAGRGGHVHWRTSTHGTYEIWAYISDGANSSNAALGTNVNYIIRPDGINGDSISLTGINQNANRGRWIRLNRPNENASTFTLNTQGYVGLALGSQGNQTIVIDAIKFISQNNNNDEQSTTSWTSGHYQNNQDISKTLTIPGATSLAVTINGETESRYDYLYIYDQYGNIVQSLDGLISKTFIVPGSSISIRFTSDNSVTKSGVTVSISASNQTPTSLTDREKSDLLMTCLENKYRGTFPENQNTQQWTQPSGLIALVREYSNGIGQATLNNYFHLRSSNSWERLGSTNDIKSLHCPSAW